MRSGLASGTGNIMAYAWRTTMTGCGHAAPSRKFTLFQLFGRRRHYVDIRLLPEHLQRDIGYLDGSGSGRRRE